MNFVAFLTYVAVSCILVALTAIVVVSCYKKNTPMARSLGIAGIVCCIITFSYFFRVLTSSVLVYSIMTSVYLVGIDFAVVLFMAFIFHFSKYSTNPWKTTFMRASLAFTLFEIVVYVVNLFYPVALEFSTRDTPIASVYYAHMTPVYWAHILFVYVMLVSILITLFRQAHRVPRQFGRQYIDTAVFVILLLVANFLGGGFRRGLVDYSVSSYSMLVLFMYWYAYQYSTHGMLNSLKMSVFDNVEQAILLFDYNGRIVLRNDRALRMFTNIEFTENLEQHDFIKSCGITVDLTMATDVCSFQCNLKSKSVTIPLRCDFRRLRDKKDVVLGNLFVFSDAVLETDNLTNFQDWESFKLFALNNKDAFTFPMMAVVCDINNLSIINSTQGHSAGDRIMRSLAAEMKDNFPPGTYFVRGPEAELIALSYGMDVDRVADCIEKIRSRFTEKFLYATEEATTWSPDIMVAIESACRGLRQKKMLDKDTVHSEMLGSLIKALQECDSDTEAHVQRTQKMGEALGRRIGLTDRQQSDLSLLCLLHDIGKIGVPLDILNKPSKLSPEEWKIIQSHVEKGYQIAKSSKDLCDIADMIRHHHERWDGKGYPDGLSRESIPLLSRVICVVDSFDAMVSDRAYRKGMSVDEAMTELMRCAGSQFDPFLVSEFLPICQMLSTEKVEVAVPKSPTVKMESLKKTTESIPSVSGRVHNLCYSRYILDSNMKIILVDENFEKLTGYSSEDVKERNLHQNDLIPKDDVAEYLCLTAESIANKQMAYCEHRICCKDGSIIYVFCYGKVFYDSASKELRSEIVITNSSDTFAMKAVVNKEKEKSDARLRHWEKSFRKDSLTGLLSHAAFMSDVEERLLDEHAKVMFFMMDLDFFKNINDSLGHHVGDELLMFVAQTLRNTLRASDLACRMGGDEFAAALIFKDSCDTEFMISRARQIYDKIAVTLSSGEHPIDLSMGVCIEDAEIRTFNQLYEAADKALYASKSNGRHCVTFYSKEMKVNAPA